MIGSDLDRNRRVGAADSIQLGREPINQLPHAARVSHAPIADVLLNGGENDAMCQKPPFQNIMALQPLITFEHREPARARLRERICNLLWESSAVGSTSEEINRRFK